MKVGDDDNNAQRDTSYMYMGCSLVGAVFGDLTYFWTVLGHDVCRLTTSMEKEEVESIYELESVNTGERCEV